jgi:hypothetical protein
MMVFVVVVVFECGCGLLLSTGVSHRENNGTFLVSIDQKEHP